MTELSQPSDEGAQRPSPLPLDQCALARAIRAVGDTWSLLILREAVYGVVRFSDMQRDLGIPKAVLADRLKRLTAAGVFEAAPYKPPGRRTYHAYRLTEKGRALLPALIALRQWSDEYGEDEPSRLKILDRRTGQAVRAALVCENGERPDALEDLILRIGPATP